MVKFPVIIWLLPFFFFDLLAHFLNSVIIFLLKELVVLLYAVSYLHFFICNALSSCIGWRSTHGWIKSHYERPSRSRNDDNCWSSEWSGIFLKYPARISLFSYMQCLLRFFCEHWKKKKKKSYWDVLYSVMVLLLHYYFWFTGLWKYGCEEASGVIKPLWQVVKWEDANIEACRLSVHGCYGQWNNFKTPTVRFILLLVDLRIPNFDTWSLLFKLW